MDDGERVKYVRKVEKGEGTGPKAEVGAVSAI